MTKIQETEILQN